MTDGGLTAEEKLIADKINKAFKEKYPGGRDPKRIRKILKEVGDIWETHTDLRLGQLLLNAMTNGKDLYYVEDDELIKMLKHLYTGG